MNNYQDIRKIIHEGEHQHQDFKYAINDSRKIARTMVAFANSGGGHLLIGVKDNGIIKGIRSDEEIYMIDTAARIFCRPIPEYQKEVVEVDGLQVLKVSVPPQDRRPFRAPDESDKWRAYVRVDDHTYIANRVVIRTWGRKKSRKGALVTYTAPERILLQYLNNHSEITATKFRRLAGISLYVAESILVKLISWDVIEIRFTDQGICYALCRKEDSGVKGP